MYFLILYTFTRYINGITGLFHIIMYCFNRISCLPRRRRHYFVTNQWEALWAGRHVQPRPSCSLASICRLQPGVLANFWKTQWGDYVIFSHGSNHSAGVAIFFNKFKGNVLETIRSDNGRWIILTVKLDNSTLIICNVYGFKVRAHNLEMFKEICDTITRLKKKYKDGYVIIGGDFNDAPDDSVDRFPQNILVHEFQIYFIL